MTNNQKQGFIFVTLQWKIIWIKPRWQIPTIFLLSLMARNANGCHLNVNDCWMSLEGHRAAPSTISHVLSFQHQRCTIIFNRYVYYPFLVLREAKLCTSILPRLCVHRKLRSEETQTLQIALTSMSNKDKVFSVKGIIFPNLNTHVGHFKLSGGK